MKITVEILEKFNACEDQIILFKKIFPKGAEPTMENLLLAYDEGLDILWIGDNIFPQEYKKFRDSAYEEYKKFRDSAWQEYEKIQGPALEEYRKIQGPAYAEYEKIQGPACEEYRETCLCYIFLLLQ